MIAKDLKPDSKNANKGTDCGRKLIAESLEKYGAGRSILVDRECRVIAGNKTLEAASKNGHKKIRVIPTDGSEIVVVQRTDLISLERLSEMGLKPKLVK